MGILNITPDSFYDGGKYKTIADLLRQVEKMIREGATFLDMGAYSSRPKAAHITEEDELHRLMPALESVLREFPEAMISIDTFRSAVAKKAIEAGACMINDISAGAMDDHMFRTVAELQVPYVIMHMVGTPKTMQQNTLYKNLTTDVIRYFSEKIFELRKLGVNDILIDPGFGFSKTLDQNYELLNNLDLLGSLELPILAGLSRKSMLYRLLNSSPENALNATTAANMIAMIKGARIIRVHDVKEGIEAIRIFEKATMPVST
jgi:dihydropteroate synthase